MKVLSLILCNVFFEIQWLALLNPSLKTSSFKCSHNLLNKCAKFVKTFQENKKDYHEALSSVTFCGFLVNVLVPF